MGGILGIAAGILTFVWPGLTLYVVAILVGVWAIFHGVSEIFAAFTLRQAGKRAERLVG